MKTMIQTAPAIVASLLALTACSDSLDRPIHFELPRDYTGPFVLIEQSNTPKAFTKQADAYRIVIPASGVLRFSDGWVLRRWHGVRASYFGGASIPVPTDSGFGFHSGSTSTSDNSTYYNWFFVGDYSAAQEFFNGRDHIERQTDWLNHHGAK